VIHLKNILQVAPLILLTAVRIGHAQTLLYQWNFDNATGTGTTLTAAPSYIDASMTGGKFINENNGAGLSAPAGSGLYGVLRSPDLGLVNSNAYRSTAGAFRSGAGDLSSVSSFTVGVWFNLNASVTNFSTLNGGALFSRLLNIATTPTGDGDELYFALNSGNALQFGVNQTNTGNTSANTVFGTLGTSPATMTNQWIFVAASYTTLAGGTVNLYVGTTNSAAALVSTLSGVGTIAWSSATNYIFIGNRGDGTRSLPGTMDDVSFYSGALTLNQVQTMQTNGVVTPPPPPPPAYTWKPVAIKGGGFVTGIITHPATTNVIYARTDIGGAYRWNATNDSWIPLLDFLGYTNRDSTLMGVESLALDPSDANRLYLACGAYPPPNAILASTNQGATFTRINPPFTMASNNDGRSNGERLAVDPNLGSTLYYASRFNGLWISTNYAATWTQVVSFPVTTTTNGVGPNFVQFIASSGVSGAATPVIYVGVSQTLTNLYRSTDAGATWQPVLITGLAGTHMPHHAAQDGLGNLYVTFCDAPGPNGISAGGAGGSVWKLNLTTLAAVNVTPPTGQGGFAGVSVDRSRPTNILVSTMDRWYPAPQDQIYRSTNGGASWKATLVTSGPLTTSAPWSAAQSSHWAGDVEIDPFNSNHAMYITGYGIIECTNLAAADSNGIVNWTFSSDGIEETVPTAIVSPPTGPSLLSVHGDIGGFQHFNLDASPPLTNYFATHRVTSTAINFAENNPAFVVRAFEEPPYGGYSADSGSTWTDFATYPATATNDSGQITVSADGSRIVWMPGSSGAYVSLNNGASWTASTNGPTGSLTPVADRVNSNKFYIYSGSVVYVSTNGGFGFNAGGTLTSGGRTPVAPFGFEGQLYIPVGDGLWRSTNSGATFAKFGNVQQATVVGFGKAAPGQSYPAIFINGQIGGGWGFFRSDDQGTNWTQINDAAHQFGYLENITGDPRIYGRCYLGASGRGILYGDIPSQATNTPPVLAAISNFTVNVGQTVAFTASATDTDLPPQTLTFSLLAGAANATLNTNNGAFSWRPVATQANTTNRFTLQVADNGLPSLTATQNFQVIVNPLTRPTFSQFEFSHGQFVFQINGESGPDYEVQTSTNLIQWDAVLITNSPPMPFTWTDINASAFRVRFYRIIAGPPLP